MKTGKKSSALATAASDPELDRDNFNASKIPLLQSTIQVNFSLGDCFVSISMISTEIV